MKSRKFPIKSVSLFLFIALPFLGFSQMKKEKEYENGFHQVSFEFLGKQNVSILSENRTLAAKSQIGIGVSTYRWTDRPLHPQMSMGYRKVDLSNIGNLGIKKHQDFYLMGGFRYFPNNNISWDSKKQLIYTFSVVGGVNLRGQSFADQIAFDMMLSGGLAYSLTKGYLSSFLILEANYRPLGSDAIASIELLPSYSISIGIVQFVKWEVK